MKPFISSPSVAFSRHSALLFFAANLVLPSISGCKNATLDLVVSGPEGISLQDQTLSASVYAPGAGTALNCESLAFGDFTLDALASALVLQSPLTDLNGRLDEIPRTGEKLVVVDAFTDDGTLLLRGCVDVGDIEGTIAIALQLQPAATVRIIGASRPLALTLERGQDTSVEIEVQALDSQGQPVTSTQVRADVFDGTQLLRGEAVTTDAAGKATVTVTRSLAGPFSLLAQAAVPLGAAAQQDAFAFPSSSSTTVNPFDGVTIVGQLPLPIGPRAGAIVAIVNRGSLAIPSDYEMRIATPVQQTDGSYGFDVEVISNVIGRPFGALYDPNQGEAVALVQTVNGLIGQLTTEQRIYPITIDSGDLSVGVALGECSIDRFAGPLMSAFRGRGQGHGNQEPTAAELENFFFDIEGNVRRFNPLGDGATVGLTPLASFCIADENDVMHRLVFVRSSIGKRKLLDLGPGITSLDTAAAQMAELRELDNAADVNGFAIGVGVTKGTTPPQLLVASLAGFSLQVSAFNSTASTDTVVGAPTELYDLPATPRLLVRAPLVDQAPSDFAVLNVGQQDDGDPGLFFMSAGDVEGGEGLFGAAELPACAPVADCVALSADIDDDGKQEVLVVKVRSPRGTPLNDSSLADLAWVQIIDLSPPADR